MTAYDRVREALARPYAHSQPYPVAAVVVDAEFLDWLKETRFADDAGEPTWFWCAVPLVDGVLVLAAQEQGSWALGDLSDTVTSTNAAELVAEAVRRHGADRIECNVDLGEDSPFLLDADGCTLNEESGPLDSFAAGMITLDQVPRLRTVPCDPDSKEAE